MASSSSAPPIPEKSSRSAPPRKRKALSNPTPSTPRFSRTGDASPGGAKTARRREKFPSTRVPATPQIRKKNGARGPALTKARAAQSVSCPPARFLQWKAVFQIADKRDTPEVSWVSIAYQPENVAPVVDDIAIQDPGVRVQGFAVVARRSHNSQLPCNSKRHSVATSGANAVSQHRRDVG